GERFMLPFVPAETAEHAQILSHLLLGVETHAILERAEVLMQRDSGHGYAILGRIRAIEKVLHRLAIGAHVCAVGVEQHALDPSMLWNQATAKFKFAVLAVGST